jgi:type I restriction-modification system DNA methylase subunit
MYRITFDEILSGSGVEILRQAFNNPETLKPAETTEQVTKASAKQFVAVANLLQKYEEKKLDPERLAHFIIRFLFCLFAEDLVLLPDKVFTNLVKQNLPAEQFRQSLKNLFAIMRTGGMFGFTHIPHFNGGLFDDDFVPDELPDIAPSLRDASIQDWSSIDPSIFGSIFEEILDEDKRKRAQLGAHYTSKEDILLVIEPVLMQPLREKWQNLKFQAESATHTGNSKEAFTLLKGFSNEVASIRVLDPACGSGNFLYVSLRQLLDLQKEIITLAARLNLPNIPLTAGPQQIYGIEINSYAHELAQITVWIGYLQWRAENGFAEMDEPILKPLHQIENKDAIIDAKIGKEPEWPNVDVIVGNPPFLGGRKMRTEFGDNYTDQLFNLYRQRLPNGSDLVCYWFEKARAQIENQKALMDKSIRHRTNSVVAIALQKSIFENA